MGAIETTIVENNLSASQVFNMDETGVNQGLGPTHETKLLLHITP